MGVSASDLRRQGREALRSGRAPEAAAFLGKAAAFAPSDPAVRSDLAAALGACGRHEPAAQEARAAAELQPELPEAWNNLGAALRRLGRHREAGAALARALQLRPDYPEAHCGLATVMRKVGRPGAAAEEYRRALSLRPHYLTAADGLAGALAELGDAEGAVAACRRAVEIEPRLPQARSSFLYTLHYSPRFDAATLYDEHRAWGLRFCEPVRRVSPPQHPNERDSKRRLRVGYVSPDLRRHTVTKFITAALKHHDYKSFELFAYSDAEADDEVTARIRGLVNHWHDTRAMTDAELETLIGREQIDILVDLRGHASANRLSLFARRPAPVQATMVGYFNTTGLSDHYRITDELMDPPGRTEHLHTETLVRLPFSCWCYTPDEGAPDVSEPPALKNRFVTFGSLNKIVKVSEPCARLWARVLEAVPGSKLLLSVAGEDAVKPMRDRLASYGLASERLTLLGKTRGSREYLERFSQIDIALDTFPFNGITTTCEGLWMGVPCVSLGGETSVSRAGRSILHAAKLPELGTDTPEQFVKVATELASDLPRLRELRLGMRSRLLSSPLMDHRRFAKDLEAAYRRMWREWCGADRHHMATASSGLRDAGQ